MSKVTRGQKTFISTHLNKQELAIAIVDSIENKAIKNVKNKQKSEEKEMKLFIDNELKKRGLN